jgi:hypothetical protein
MMRKLFLFIASYIFIASVQAQIITTIAGGGTSGLGDGGPAIDCELYQPYSTAVDGLGNIYIADAGNNRIRKVNTSGTITTIAGTGSAGYNGDNIAATAAQLNGPVGVAVDLAGNIYIGDDFNNRIRKVNVYGVITTVAGTGVIGHSGDGGLATAAQLYRPHCIAIDHTGNVYIADYGNGSIRKINTSGLIATIAGISGSLGNSGDNGAATAAKLFNPDGIAVDAVGNVYVGDISANCVRKISNSGIITKVAGTGVGGYNGDGGMATAAQLLEPVGVAVNISGDIYIADGNNLIRKVDTSGIINTIAGHGTSGYNGDGGPATLAQLRGPTGVLVDSYGNIYIADFGNDRIRYIRNMLSIDNADFLERNITVFPNPANDKLTVLNAKETELVIYDIVGREVYRKHLVSDKGQLNISSFLSGIYIVQLSDQNGGKRNFRVVKE